MLIGPRHAGGFDVAIVGSGFAGSILARTLAAAGRRVVLCERGRHPRFALGESSTPLASLALERLARRPGLADLYDLSTWGRWQKRRPELRRGLKRGFTFYAQRHGEPYMNDADNSRRLLVAASPSDAIADTHWLRADVDAHLVDQAVRAGVNYRELTFLDGADIGSGGVRLSGTGPEGRVTFDAGLVVDGSGPAGFLAEGLALPDRSEHVPFAPGLLYAHLEGAGDFVALARAGGAVMDDGPYPDERAAVHHLLDEGWMYVLPFDHGVASCGFVLDRDGPRAGETPEAAWHRLLSRYPTLENQFGRARFVVGPRWQPRVSHRLATAAGERFFLLPHTFAFFDPMFSTGIAWSLLAVERLAARLIEDDGGNYADLLTREADQMERLIVAARAARDDFVAFVAITWLYFAVVSFEEARQRLLPPPDGRAWCWQPFLAAGEPAWNRVFAAAAERAGKGPALRAWVAEQIAERDVAGFLDPQRRNLHPVDLDVLIERAPLLGLGTEEIRRALPRLRGMEDG